MNRRDFLEFRDELAIRILFEKMRTYDSFPYDNIGDMDIEKTYKLADNIMRVTERDWDENKEN